MARLAIICLTTTGLLFLTSFTFNGVSSDSVLQLHRALPGSNGKPGYRVSSSASVADKSSSYESKHGPGTDKKTDDTTHQSNMDFASEWSQAAFYSVISTILVGLSGIFPLLVIPLEAGPSLKHGAGSSMLKLLLSFAVGSLLGDVFLHLLPEAWATVDGHSGHTVTGLWVIGGLLAFLIIEKIFGEAEEEDEEEEEKQDSGEPALEETTEEFETSSEQTNGGMHLRSRKVANGHCNGHTNYAAVTAHNSVANGTSIQHSTNKQPPHESHIKVTGYLNLLANCVDNFTHGLAVAGSYLVSPKVGLCTTIAILLHEIPHEIGDFAILLRSGFDRWKAAKAQVLTASGGVLGALTALFAESASAAGDRTAWILPFTAGGFIYIALVTVVPDLLKEKSVRQSMQQIFFILLGVFSMLLVTLLFDAHET